MSAKLLVQAPGGLATVQDLGRPGWRRIGVPRCGALVPHLLRIANRLAGNAEGAAAIEFFLAGPTLEALDAPVQLAFAGDFALALTTGAERQTTALPSWRSVTLLPGDVLKLGAPRSQRVGYVAVAGLRCPPTLGSASTYQRAGLGGLRGTALASGDRLDVAAAPLRNGRGALERVLREVPPSGMRAGAEPALAAPIRVVPGPQADYFDAAALATFFAADYTVTAEADRMGVRLQGERLLHRADKGAEITSDGTVPGSIQVPGNGQPIVLLADGQTAGGYPKIGTVISADLPRLAVVPVGSRLRFASVSVEQGEVAAREAEAQLQRWLGAIRPLLVEGEIDLEAIYADNLISGMIDAVATD